MSFGGLDPWGYHLVNLVLHGAAAALFFLVAARLLRAGLGPTAGDEAVLAGALAPGSCSPCTPCARSRWRG